MDKKKRVPNIDALLQKIEDFLEEMPTGEDDNVNWEELSERKKTAQRALDLLDKILKEKEEEIPKQYE
jgi:hypothetical protein